MMHKIMETKDGPLHYWVSGSGSECLLFTHGMTLNHRIFDPQVDYFKDRYTVITWDLPMHGQSRPYNEFSQTDSVELLFRILDQESFRRAHLIGQSMGGYVLQEAAWKHPERVASMAMVGVHPLGHGYYWPVERWIMKHGHQILAFIPYRLIVEAVTFFSGNHTTAKKRTRQALLQNSKKEIRTLVHDVYRDFLSFEQPLPIDDRIPVRLFYGTWDFAGRLKKWNKQWAEREGFSYVSLSNAAHSVHIDTPEKFNKLYDQFLFEVQHFDQLINQSDFLPAY